MDCQGEMDRGHFAVQAITVKSTCNLSFPAVVSFFLILYPPISNLSFYPLHLPSVFQTFILTILSNLLLLSLCLLHTFFPSCSLLPHHLFFFSLSFIIPLIFTSSGMVLEVLQQLRRALYRPQSAQAGGLSENKKAEERGRDKAIRMRYKSIDVVMFYQVEDGWLRVTCVDLQCITESVVSLLEDFL